MSKKYRKFAVLLLGLVFTGIIIHYAALYRARHLIIGDWNYKNKYFSETITFYPKGIVEWNYYPEVIPGDDYASSYKYGHLVGHYVVTGKNTIFARQDFYKDQDSHLEIYPELNSGVSKDDMQIEFTYRFSSDGKSICFDSTKPGLGGLCYKRMK